MRASFSFLRKEGGWRAAQAFAMSHLTTPCGYLAVSQSHTSSTSPSFLGWLVATPKRLVGAIGGVLGALVALCVGVTACLHRIGACDTHEYARVKQVRSVLDEAKSSCSCTCPNRSACRLFPRMSSLLGSCRSQVDSEFEFPEGNSIGHEPCRVGTLPSCASVRFTIDLLPLQPRALMQLDVDNPFEFLNRPPEGAGYQDGGDIGGSNGSTGEMGIELSAPQRPSPPPLPPPPLPP